jgi:hypothetical protein
MVERFNRITHSGYSERAKFDLQLGSAQDDEDRLAMTLQTTSIELKTERHDWERTGNIIIEYQNDGRPSGIAITEAEWWVHELARGDETVMMLWIRVPRLDEVCRSKIGTAADVPCGDGKRGRGILLSLRELLQSGRR